MDVKHTISPSTVKGDGRKGEGWYDEGENIQNLRLISIDAALAAMLMSLR